MKTIKIGGVDRPIRLRKYMLDKILSRYNIIYSLSVRRLEKKTGREYNPETDTLTIDNIFFYWALWKLLDKKWFWPFRKPFRSLRKMIKEIEIDEFKEMIDLISTECLKMYELQGEPDQKKKH